MFRGRQLPTWLAEPRMSEPALDDAGRLAVPAADHRLFAVPACIGLFLWLAAAGAGLAVLARYENEPGTAADAPARWPPASVLTRVPGAPTLILLAHPHCTCTPASLAELAEVLARADARVRTYVLFLRPEGFTDAWVETDLWRQAASI